MTEASIGADRTANFSLLIPVYRGDDATQLRLAVESSTAAQSLRPAELVIVQDGPVTTEVGAELARIVREGSVPTRIVELPENRGLTVALNLGIEECRFPVIARMDADDVSLPERFERQWALMEEGYDLVGTGMVEFETDPAIPVSRRVPPVGAERIRAHARTHNPFNHPTMMYRVAALERVGKYLPFGKMEDYWLGVRLIASGARVENLADPLVAYRVGSGAFARRGGMQEARTELRLQRELLHLGFTTRAEYVRNVVMKGAYRLLPAGLKKVLFRGLISGGLPGDRKS